MKDQETNLAGVQKFPVILQWLKNFRLHPVGRREGSYILRTHKYYALNYKILMSSVTWCLEFIHYWDLECDTRGTQEMYKNCWSENLKLLCHTDYQRVGVGIVLIFVL